jgi:hypothetical protein
MSQQPPTQRGPSQAAGRGSARDRDGRRMKLVPDQWITELAELAVMRPSAPSRRDQPLQVVSAFDGDPPPTDARPDRLARGSRCRRVEPRTLLGRDEGPAA